MSALARDLANRRELLGDEPCPVCGEPVRSIFHNVTPAHKAALEKPAAPKPSCGSPEPQRPLTLDETHSVAVDVFHALALVRMEVKHAGGAAEVNLASAQRCLERAWDLLDPR